MIRVESAIKVLDYFFGKDVWQKFPVVEVAVRHETDKPNVFNDELIVINTKTGSALQIVWNTDPSRYHIGNRDIAKLRPGVHFYTLSYHHKYNDKKRYVALRPKTAGEMLPVWRKNKRGEYYTSNGQAINQHAGGQIATGSEGCQTARVADYPKFIDFIAKGLGVKVWLGNIRKPTAELNKGIGTIPYILVTQKQFDYIMKLPENRFDATDDLAYQMANFVNVPKVERVTPVDVQIEQVATKTDELIMLTKLEQDEDEFINLNASDESEETETPDEPIEGEKTVTGATGEQETTSDGQPTVTKLEVSEGKIKAEVSDSTPPKNENIAVIKPEPKDFLGKMRLKISTLTGGNVTLQAIRDWAEQAEFLGLSVKFWFWISAIAIGGTLIYLISEFYKHRSDTKRDLDLTNKLVEANSTPTNVVKLISEDEAETYRKQGYRIITR